MLGLQPVGQEARRAHEAIIKHVLRAGTQISLLLRSPHPAKREYLVDAEVVSMFSSDPREGLVLADERAHERREEAAAERLRRELRRGRPVTAALAARRSAAARRRLRPGRYDDLFPPSPAHIPERRDVEAASAQASDPASADASSRSAVAPSRRPLRSRA